MSAVRTKSLLRRAEYEELQRLTIEGAILDVGGSKKSGYLNLIGGTHTVTVGNIDESYGLDIVFDAEEIWPCHDASFQAVFLINILEHLYKHEHAVTESYRVLSNGGRVVGVVPFLLNIHSAPRDFFRYTRFTLERLLADAGFTNIEVRELGTGLFSVLYQTCIAFVPLFLATPLIVIAKGMDSLLDRIKPNSALSKKILPLGYYFEATK